MTTPVVLITGFLGAGKTTLINHLVTQPGLERTVVIVNEFGDVNIDAALIAKRDHDVIELTNGCVCCALQGTLADTLADMGTASRREIDRVVVETTGLANAGPLAHLLMADERLQHGFRLDRIVAVVDAINGSGTLDRHPESVEQIAVADVVVMTKTDLSKTWEPLRERIEHLSPTAAVHVAPFARIPADLLLAARPASVTRSRPRPAGDHGPHDQHMRAITLTRAEPMTRGQLSDLWSTLGTEFDANLLRVKGLVRVDAAPGPALVHGAQGLMADIEWLESWPTAEPATTLVFIGWDLDETRIRELLAQA